MRLPILYVLIAFTMVSCHMGSKVPADMKETCPYYVEGRRLFKEEVIIGRVLSTEYEMVGDEIYQEISIGINNHASMIEVEDILRYLRSQYPKAKLEINIDELLED